MSRRSLTEEEAKIVFAKQIDALAEEGTDPDCQRHLAEIIDENEAECAAMERAEEVDRKASAAFVR